MAALLVEVADAVVAALNAATLSREFTAVRDWRPVETIEGLEDLSVTVVPRAAGGERASRAADRAAYSVEVSVRQKPEGVTNADIDPLVLLCQEVADLFRGRPLEGMPALTCTGWAIDPVVGQEDLEQSRSFASLVALQFDTWR